MIEKDKYEFWWLMTTGNNDCPNLCSARLKSGYIIITTCSKKHRLSGKKIQEFEHRIVMEEWLCRKLNRNEDIHHINLNKSDNKIKNLFLCSRKDHLILHRDRKNT